MAGYSSALAAVPYSDYNEAKDLLGKHKWAEAAIVLRSVLRKSPDSSAATLDLARALTYLGRREEALSLLIQSANREKGPRRQSIIRRARVLSRLFLTNATFQAYQDGLNLILAKKYRNAQERFSKALEAEPENIEVLTRIGQCLVLDGDNDSAAERLRLAKRLNPYEPEVKLWLGRAMHQRGELTLAIEELKSAQEELAGSELAPVWYAEALYSIGQPGTAIDVLEKDLKARPFHVQALVTLARIKTSLRNTEMLWSSRKDLQLAQSRLTEYAGPNYQKSESELGLNLRRSSEDLQSEIQKLLRTIDGRLEETNSDSET